MFSNIYGASVGALRGWIRLFPSLPLQRGVDLICSMYPQSDIAYLTFAGMGHVLAMYASQLNWLGKIEDRFAAGGRLRDVG